MSCGKKFYYCVLEIPNNGAAQTLYSQCSYNPSILLTQPQQYYLSCPTQFYNWGSSSVEGDCPTPSKCQFTYTTKCVPITYNLPNGGSCNTNPPSKSCQICPFSIYQSLGGDPNYPPTSNTGMTIPCVGGKYPINLTVKPQYMATYADLVYGSSKPNNSNGAVSTGYIVVAYDQCWVNSFEDLDTLAPKDSSPFVNQKGAQFYFNTAQNTQGPPIPNLEDQFPELLESFCSRTSTQCNTGEAFCSNFYSESTGGSPNYCYDAYKVYLSEHTGNASDKAVENAITTFCGQFKDNIPAECQCLDKSSNSLFKDFNNSIVGKLSPPACWWTPCRVPATFLIDYATYKNGEGHCPQVCGQVFEVMRNAKINSKNSQVDQFMVCCQSGGTNTCCQNPDQKGCAGSGPTPEGETFWQKYGLWIIGLIIFILVLSVLIGIIIYSRKR